MEMVPLAPSCVAGGGGGSLRVHSYWNGYEGVVHVLTAGIGQRGLKKQFTSSLPRLRHLCPRKFICLFVVQPA